MGEPEWDTIDYISEDRLIVSRDGLCGVMDGEGHVLVEPVYSWIGSYHEGLARVQKDGMYGYLDLSGHVAIPFDYESAGNFSDGYAAVALNGYWGIIDTQGNEVIPIEYEYANNYTGLDLFYITRDEAKLLINKQGETVLDLSQWGSVSAFSEGLAFVSDQDGKYGVIDTEGNLVVEPQFDFYDGFSEGLSVVRVEGECGFIDHEGNYVVPLRPVQTFNKFKNGRAVFITQDRKYGLIDKEGHIITEGWRIIHSFHEDRARVTLGLYDGYIDAEGHVIVEPMYSAASDYSNGLAAVWDLYGEVHFIDVDGNIVE